jgi:hypothetical protein
VVFSLTVMGSGWAVTSTEFIIGGQTVCGGEDWLSVVQPTAKKGAVGPCLCWGAQHNPFACQ